MKRYGGFHNQDKWLAALRQDGPDVQGFCCVCLPGANRFSHGFFSFFSIKQVLWSRAACLAPDLLVLCPQHTQFLQFYAATKVTATLDVRTIPARQRHPLIFTRLDALSLGEALLLVNDHDPKPLRYQLIAERPEQFSWEPQVEGPEEWAIRIKRVAEQ